MASLLDRKPPNELVERIAASRAFHKASRPKELLFYLAGRATESPMREVREQEIGAAVFGRPADYDTSVDNIVRVNVYDLRKRLETYFSKDGLAEPTVIEIPKGSYCPVFTKRESAATPDSGAAARLGLGEPGEDFFRTIPKRYLFPAAAVALAFVCILLTWRNIELSQQLAGPKADPSLQRLWSRMFRAGRSTEVVVADSVVGFLQDVTRKPLPIKEYSNSGSLPKSMEASISPEQHSMLEYLMSQRYTSMADVHTLQRLFLLSGSESGRLNVHFSRDFSADRLNDSNVVLIGSKKANPWVGLCEQNLNFQFEYDDANGSVVIQNRQPKPGEQTSYVTTLRPASTGPSYGLVAFIPNQTLTGNIVIIEGAGVASTEAAGELVTNDALFGQLTAAIGATPGKPLPYFEVLFKTKVMGSSMQAPQIVTWHTRQDAIRGR